MPMRAPLSPWSRSRLAAGPPRPSVPVSAHGGVARLRARIGCVFLARDGSVLRVVDPLPRGRVASARGAHAVVECAAGRLAGVAAGARLRLEIPARSKRLEAPAGG